MRKIKLLLIVPLLFSILGTQAQLLKAKGGQIVTDKNEPIILKGIGLGGWMLQEGYMLKVQGIGQQQHVVKQNIQTLVGAEKTEQFYSAWLQNHTRKIDIDSMASWGFNSVRLPMHYNLYTLPVEDEPVAGQNTWLEKGFALTDSLLNWCKANKMYLILDLHAAPGGQGNDLNISDRDPNKGALWSKEANLQKTIALWKKLAERYANEPWIGAYDIINEPNWGFSDLNDKNGCAEKENAPLKKLMQDITAAIREVDKNHVIIIEGNCWGNNYSGLLPPWDDNMALSFHKYWNYNDQASIQGFLNFREQYSVPVWLGETGENSNLWFRDAIHLLDKNQIGYAWWPLKKLGANNPLQVKTPALYQKTLDFWANKGPKPSADEAFKGLMELAENLKLENCIYHHDVIDAMMRQPYTDAVIPFKKHQAKKGLRINAVDYDLGRNGKAYYDLDTANYWVSENGKRSAGNHGNTYRNDGVDIELDNQISAHIINHIEPTEWTQYTIAAEKAKTYSLVLHVKTENQNGKVRVTINNKPLTPLNLPNTNNVWSTVSIKSVSLTAGLNTIRVEALAGSYELNVIELK